MPRQQRIIALPRRIQYTERDGYAMTVKITDGPQHLIDRIIVVRLTAEQLDAIADWDAKQDRSCDLEPEPPHTETE